MKMAQRFECSPMARETGVQCQVILKTQKMVLDVSLINIQHYKVRVKSKVEQARERINALSDISALERMKKELSGSPWLRQAKFAISFNL